MRLKKKQKEFLLKCVAEGLESDEINERAAKFKPAFSVSRQQVDFYRGSRGVRIEELKEAGEIDALSQGFALRDERVRVLSEIGKSLYKDLKQCTRSLADGEFKEGEIRQLRGIFDDLAKEMGDRKTKLEHSGDAEKPLTIRVEYE
jgi:hypothetical protein